MNGLLILLIFGACCGVAMLCYHVIRLKRAIEMEMKRRNLLKRYGNKKNW